MIVCKSEKIKPDNKNFVDCFTHEILRIYSKIKKRKGIEQFKLTVKRMMLEKEEHNPGNDVLLYQIYVT